MNRRISDLEIASREAKESSVKMLALLKQGELKRDVLTNSAIPFSEKENDYLIKYSRLLKARIFSSVLGC